MKSGYSVHTGMYWYAQVCTKYMSVHNVENGTYMYVLVCTEYVQVLRHVRLPLTFLVLKHHPIPVLHTQYLLPWLKLTK
jgi:hypothetical protein